MDDFPTEPIHVRDGAIHGFTRQELAAGVNNGLLVRRTRGVYVRADLPDTVDLRAAIVGSVVSPHHVVTDRTAAWLHGIDMLTMSEHDVLPPIETCALRGRNPTHRPEADGRSRDLAPSDVVDVAGIQVTSPQRTALDLGCNLRRREAFAAMTCLARLHGFSAADLGRELPRFRGRRGVIQCRQLVALVDARIESPREAWVWLQLYDEGLPMPEPQWWIEVDGIPTYRLDFAYVNARVCVEYDGAEFHDQTVGQRADDDERRTWLRDNGWTVIVVKRGDFAGAGLARWTGELRAALAPSYSNRRW